MRLIGFSLPRGSRGLHNLHLPKQNLHQRLAPSPLRRRSNPAWPLCLHR